MDPLTPEETIAQLNAEIERLNMRIFLDQQARKDDNKQALSELNQVNEEFEKTVAEKDQELAEKDASIKELVDELDYSQGFWQILYDAQTVKEECLQRRLAEKDQEIAEKDRLLASFQNPSPVNLSQ